MCWRRVALLCWGLGLQLALASPPASPIDHALPTSEDVLIVTVSLNQVSKGEAFIASADEKSVYVRRSDFERWGTIGLNLPEVIIDNRPYLLLAQSSVVQFELKLEALQLVVQVSPIALGMQRINLAGSRRQESQYDSLIGGYLNYGLSVQTNRGSGTTAASEFAANLSQGATVMRSEHTFQLMGDQRKAVRLQSYLLRDDPERQLRYIVGDTSSASGVFSRSPPVAGISITRQFDLAPGLLPTPSFGYAGAVRTPTTAEIYVDGVRLRTVELRPGRFELHDLNYFAGLRNITVLLRDRQGNVESASLQHYFSPINLAKGLHQFRYVVGAGRDELSPNQYRGLVWSASHRYGVSDSLTLNGAAERQEGFRRLGVGILNASTLGTIGIDLSASQAPNSALSGNAALFTYGLAVRALNFSTSMLAQSRHFGVADADRTRPLSSQTLATSGAPNNDGGIARQWQMSIGAALGARRGLSASVVRSRLHGRAESELVSSRFTQGFGKGYSLIAAVARRNENGARQLEGSLSITIPLGRAVAANISHESRGAGGGLDALRLAKTTPIGEGLGYRLGIERERGNRTIDGATEWNHALGTVQAQAIQRQAADGSSATSAEARFTGAITRSRGSTFLSPSIVQGFAVVEVEGLPNVRVYQNNQFVGKTSKDGKLLLPSISPYSDNQIRIDDRDIPLDREIRAMTAIVVPRAYTGTYVPFASKTTNAIGGKLLTPTQRRAVASAELRIVVAGVEQVGTTTPEGDFYFEDIPAGEYKLRAESRTLSCLATLSITSTRVPFRDLGEVDCVPL